MIFKGICNYTVVPVRREPKESSEMVTQILFGETFEIVEKSNKWNLIKADFDGFSGWIDAKMFKPVKKEMYDEIASTKSQTIGDLYIQAKSKNYPGNIPIIAGSTVYSLEGTQFKLGDESFNLVAEPNIQNGPVLRNDIVKVAETFLNIPYLWGGRSTFGIDCSGLVQTVLKICGLKAPHDASQQALIGKNVASLNAAKPGDIAFFENEKGKIIHTGIIIHDEKIIHASGRVRIDTIHDEGIFNESTGVYSHRLKLLRNVMDL